LHDLDLFVVALGEPLVGGERHYRYHHLKIFSGSNAPPTGGRETLIERIAGRQFSGQTTGKRRSITG
jgi:hypothetical protein